MNLTARTLGAAFIALSLTACMPQKNLHPDLHGHRGCRGLLPENSIPGFTRAVELGCDFLELDVVLSGDGQVIVSHEPWMSHSLCLDPHGDSITPAQEPVLNLFHMTTKQIQAYDCGSVEQPAFPEQEQRKTYKPTLREVVETVDEFALTTGMMSPSFNIEIKSDPAWYGTFQPEPGPYVAAVLATIDSLGLADRCIIQSFDPAILEAVNASYPSITLALLVENEHGWKKNLKRLSFTPAVYSPVFTVVDEDLVESLHLEDIEIIVWTVNEEADIKRMLDLGVDGIITDYPDRVMKVADEE
ncbi:MAG: glycerophosphodiester phosphodiesterase family protein [Flavobacteriales bacterium]